MATYFKVKVVATGSASNLFSGTFSGFRLGVSGSIHSPLLMEAAVPFSLGLVSKVISGNELQSNKLSFSIGFSGSGTALNVLAATSAFKLAATASLNTVTILQATNAFTFGVRGILHAQNRLNLTTAFSLRAICMGRTTNATEVPIDTKIQSVWGINGITGGHFVYDNYPFNSFFKIGSDYFATSNTGIYKLDGILDNTSKINWRASSCISNLETEKLKAVPDAYVETRADGDIYFRLITDERTDRAAYTINGDDRVGIHRRRVKTAKGILGNNWQVELYSDAPRVEVKLADITINVLKRSI